MLLLFVFVVPGNPNEQNIDRLILAATWALKIADSIEINPILPPSIAISSAPAPDNGVTASTLALGQGLSANLSRDSNKSRLCAGNETMETSLFAQSKRRSKKRD